jgi:hypothetical protein
MYSEPKHTVAPPQAHLQERTETLAAEKTDLQRQLAASQAELAACFVRNHTVIYLLRIGRSGFGTARQRMAHEGGTPPILFAAYG